MTIQVSHRLLLPLVTYATVCGVFALAGCERSSKATVSGIVTYQGKLLPSGTVAFFGKDNKVVTGAIDSDGQYSVSRVPVGPVKISVSTPPAMNKATSGGMPTLKSISIPVKYKNPEQSGLTYIVTPGAQEHPIELN